MTTPNDVLRAVRMGRRLSQDELAQLVQAASRRLGQRTTISKRTIQRWESGTIAAPQPAYARALEAALGLPLDSLGFSPTPQARVADDGRGGHDLVDSPVGIASGSGAPTVQAAPSGTYSGVWLSTYEYVSSGRGGQVFTGLHYVLLLQHGDRLTGRSLPGASPNRDSPLTLDLQVDGSIVTGTWTEQTAPEGYYRGARYHGAIQMLVEPTGRRMAGKWVGFGKDFEINSGPWELKLMDSSTSKATLAEYSRPPEA